MAPPLQQHGFMLSWTQGDPNDDSVAGPFMDPSQDMVDLELTRLGDTNYQAHVTRIVGGFSNPIDAEILSNKVYVIEYSGNKGIWEVTFPTALPPTRLRQPARLARGAFGFNVTCSARTTYQI